MAVAERTDERPAQTRRSPPKIAVLALGSAGSTSAFPNSIARSVSHFSQPRDCGFSFRSGRYRTLRAHWRQDRCCQARAPTHRRGHDVGHHPRLFLDTPEASFPHVLWIASRAIRRSVQPPHRRALRFGGVSATDVRGLSEVSRHPLEVILDLLQHQASLLVPSSAAIDCNCSSWAATSSSVQDPFDGSPSMSAREKWRLPASRKSMSIGASM